MVVGDVPSGTDVLIIGGGPGGYVAAIRAGQLDLDVTMVEKDAYGGTCLNHGCIPSKALISATDVAHRAGTAEEMGIHADPAVDMKGMVGWKDDVVDQLTGGVEKLSKAAGVNLISGRAEFVDENTARVVHEGEGQGAETIEFERAVVATGSRPIQIPGIEFDGENVISSREALSLGSVPERLVVVGGGYIGMELSTVFAKLGTDVTVVEMLDDILPAYEEDVTKVVRKRANELGIDFHFGHAADEVKSGPNGPVLTTETEDGETGEFAADKVLVAVGRQPVTDTLDLEAIGLEPNEDGFLEIDAEGRTDRDHVFAVGDVAGEPMLAHKAMKEGEVVAEVAAGKPAALDYVSVPAAVFTDPEIGTVGLTEAEAEQEGFDPITGQMPFRANGRALTTGEQDGFVRLVADADTEFILGAQIVGPEASELAMEVSLAIEMGAQLEDIASTMHTHPTLSEAVMEAAANALGEAVHTLNR